MDFSQIRTLIHVVELGSLSRAADRLNIAQPALSRQIRLFEAELGRPLFVRHGRGMLPTDLARELLEPAMRVMADLDHMRAMAARREGEVVGRVRFGMPPTVSDIMSVTLVREIRAAHPRMSLGITSAFSGHLLDWVKRDALDFAVCYDPRVDPTLRVQPVMLEELLLVGSASSGLDGRTAVPFASLASMPLVLPSSLHGLRILLEKCAAEAGVVLKPIVEADAFAAMLDLVTEGIGVTVLPLAPIHARVRAGELSTAPIRSPNPVRRLVLTFPADRPLENATRKAAEVFVRLAEQKVTSGVWAGRMLSSPVER